MPVVFDLTKNAKQARFFDEVMRATIPGASPYRYFCYGGGIRGGKTSVSLTAFHLLARKYANSRWHVIRDSFPNLEATTIPSFEKFYPETSPHIEKYYRSRSNFHVRYKNGSRIYFSSENLKQDPQLNWLLGIETNGILLEQVEGINVKTWQRALERAGSWYIDPMPPALILATFNPTQTWVKDMVYTPWRNDMLKPPFYFMQALPDDSPFITDDQWAAWRNLDDISYRQFIRGDWEAFSSVKRFAYAFDETRHTVGEIDAEPTEPLHLSFDFNHAPVTCIIAQIFNERINVLREVSSDRGLSDLIFKVSEFIGDKIVFVTGDRSGWNQSELLDGNRAAYDLIKDGLGLTQYQIKAPLTNPNLFKSRELVNSLFQNYPHIRIAKYHCPQLINDFKFVEADETHRIIKNRNKQEGKADFLDCWRYLVNTHFPNFVKI